MAYTVKQLAKLSGVSSRTLRFYDEIDLLNPAYIGGNKYRYYEEQQLLMLQQILFFRELGFSLKEIQDVMGRDDFDKIDSLRSHRTTLELNIERTQVLINTIDKTIAHLKGNITMSDLDMYDGFDANKQKEHEKHMIDNNILNQNQIDDSWRRASNWKKKDWEVFKKEGDDLAKLIQKEMENNTAVNSNEMENLIARHIKWVDNFWTPNKESYIGLSQTYLEHPDYKSFYDNYHPKLAEYLASSMIAYAKKYLN